MTDILKIAVERRNKLQEEIAKLDEFVVMAESLMRGAGNAAGATPVASRLAGATPKPAAGSPKPDAPAEPDDVAPNASAPPPKTATAPSKASTAPPKTAAAPPMTASAPATDAPRQNMARRSMTAN